MLKLTLNSVNIDLGWGVDKCYTKVKNMDMVTLLKDNMLGCNEESYDDILEYYICDVEYGVEDIPKLDEVMLGFKEVLEDSLMLFDSYANYEESKLKGSGIFKIVLSNLADYDVVSYNFIKLVPKIYVKSDITLNIVVFDYTKRVLKVMPLCDILNNVSYKYLVLSDSTPLFFYYIDKDKYKVSNYCTLEQFRSLLNNVISDGKVVLI